MVPGKRFFFLKISTIIPQELSLLHTNMKTRYFLILPMMALVLTACQTSMPEVPSSGRKVVGPRGSSESLKPWSVPTKQEGDATLGPLSDMNRR